MSLPCSIVIQDKIGPLYYKCSLMTWYSSPIVFTICSDMHCRSYFTTDSKSVCLGVGHPFGAHDQILLFPFFCQKTALLFVLGCPLWREDGSLTCNANCQWLELQRTQNHTLLFPLGSLSVTFYNSQGLWWKYSYPLPHGVFFTCIVFHWYLYYT
jgi:hypothetical protein